MGDKIDFTYEQAVDIVNALQLLDFDISFAEVELKPCPATDRLKESYGRLKELLQPIADLVK